MKRIMGAASILMTLLFLSGGSLYAQGSLSGLLTSTPWCSFRYNKTTGYSSSTRYQFFTDGTYSKGGRSEGHSSGSGGTFGSQRNTGSSGQWQLQGNALYYSSGGSVQGPANLVIKRNSNGSPIIVADGVEFVPCR